MVSTNIQTGVDKLVGLVSEKKKIAVDAAAKILGVGRTWCRNGQSSLKRTV